MKQIIVLVCIVAVLFVFFAIIFSIIVALTKGSRKSKTNKSGTQDEKLPRYKTFPGEVTIRKKGTSNAECSYASQGSILTMTEQTFYKQLKEAVGDQYGISMKVRLADVVKPASKENWQTAFNKISRKHLDFVLYDPATFQIKAAIELDDSSHQKQSRKDRDDFLNEIMKQAHVPLFHFAVKKDYQFGDLQSHLQESDQCESL